MGCGESRTDQRTRCCWFLVPPVRRYVAMSCEVIVTNVRVNNDCQRGVCGVGSTDFDSWVTDPAWEREALAATKAAEQHYIKCLKNNVKVEDCYDSSLADTLSFDSISPPCLDCSSGESTIDDGETTSDEGVAGLQQSPEASSNIGVRSRARAPAFYSTDSIFCINSKLLTGQND